MASGRSRSRSREARAVAVLGLAVAAFWGAALATAGSSPLVDFFAGLVPTDLCGPVGAELAAFTTRLLGAPAAPSAPLLLAAGMLVLFTAGRRRLALVKLVAAWLLLLPPILGVLGAERAAGLYGARISGRLVDLLGRAGAIIVVGGLFVAGILALTDLSVPRPVRGALGTVGHGLRAAFRALGSIGLGGGLFRIVRRASASVAGIWRRVGERLAEARVAREARRALAHAEAGEPDPPLGHRAERVEPAALRSVDERAEPGIVEPFVANDAPELRRGVKKVHRVEERRKRPAAEFELPTIALLTPPPARIERASRRDLLDLSETLRRTLEEFGIRGRVSEVHPGPVITRYDFEPAPGIKVNQIVSREDDIALALKTDRVRILTRLPGKAAVGIEIPNDLPDLIPFVELVAAPTFMDGRGVLTLVFGKDTAGKPFCDHLETMPHLLVAGTTGSGKSVCINAIIASLLFRHRPEELRLILIDPKMLELTGYNGIPHLALPVVTESRDAAKALNWLVREMERRYRCLATHGARNIQAYREKYFGPAPVRVPADAEPPESMPYIVCIVDELADLMMTNASEVETPIARLAQMARAVGIHLILATQRPSVDVLTGVIKANFPARVAFQVASRVDSRTILDQNGAESLVGRGDMLYLQAGRSVPVRLHGAFLPDPDIEALVRYLRSFVSDVAPIDIEEKVPGMLGGPSEEDPLFGEAARVVVLQGQASTSLLQRRLKIGYARAGRLMDQLESAGIVSAFEGSKARDVLVDLEYLEKQGIV